MYSIVNTTMSGKCIRFQDGNTILLIPENSENTDYQRYLAWLSEGNEPEAAEL